MSKALLYAGLGLGAAAIGFVAYKMMQQPSQTYTPTSANPYTNPNFTTDPYQTYPFQANIPPRVDNSNQPWANNNRAALNGASVLGVDVNLTNAKMFADVLNSGSDIIDSGQSIWNNVSSWFDSGDSEAFSGDWTGLDNSLTSWDWANLA